MRTYECMVILDPGFDAKDTKKRDALIAKLLGEYNKNIKEIRDWGKRELKYEINKFKDGIYLLLILESTDPIKTSLIQGNKRLMPEVLRFLLIEGGSKG